jgi:hypothetical protein
MGTETEMTRRAVVETTMAQNAKNRASLKNIGNVNFLALGKSGSFYVLTFI